MARLPVPSSDEGTWGALLNEFLRVAHREDGTLRGIIDVANVKDFGAVGDGTTDDSAAIQEALTYASDNSLLVFFPSGTYIVSKSFTIPIAGNVDIVGAGRNLVTLIGANNRTFIYLPKNSSLRISGIKAIGFKFFIQYLQDTILDSIEVINCEFEDISDSVFASGDGVNIQYIRSFIFNDNVANNIGNINSSVAVVRMTSNECLSVNIFNNQVRNVGSPKKSGSSFAFHLRVAQASGDNVAKTIISGNIIKSVRSNSIEDTCGIMVIGGQTIIKGNHLEDVISSNTSSTDNEGIYIKCQNSLITENILKNCGGNEGVIMIKGRNRDEDPVNATSAAGFDNIISQNSILQTMDLGIKTTGIHVTMDGCLVTNNHISGSFRGVALGSNVRNTIISNNMIYGLNHYNTNEYIAGINVNNPNDCQILDNQISNLASKEECYGIYIYGDGSNYSGCIIRGNWINELYSNKDSLSRALAINLEDIGSCQKLILESNHINNVGRGIQVNNISVCEHSAQIYNSFSNCRLSSLSPTTGWTVNVGG